MNDDSRAEISSTTNISDNMARRIGKLIKKKGKLEVLEVNLSKYSLVQESRMSISSESLLFLKDTITELSKIKRAHFNFRG